MKQRKMYPEKISDESYLNQEQPMFQCLIQCVPLKHKSKT